MYIFVIIYACKVIMCFETCAFLEHCYMMLKIICVHLASVFQIFIHVYKAKRRVMQCAPDTNKQSKQAKQSSANSMKLARTLFIIFVIFAACWAPYAILIVADR